MRFLALPFIALLILGVGCAKETKNEKTSEPPTTTIKGLLKYTNGQYAVIKDFRTHLKKTYLINAKLITKSLKTKFKSLVGKEVVLEVQIKNDHIVKVINIEKYVPELVPAIIEGLVEIYANKDVYIVEKWQSRSRRSYKVMNMTRKIASYKGKIIKVKGKIRRYSPFSGEIHVDKILTVK